MATKTDGPLGRSLGRGKEAEVFELGTLAAKIYGTAAGKQRSFGEAMNLAVAGSLGLPVPAARCVQQLGGRWALVMDRVGGPSFAQLLESNPEVMPESIEEMVTLQLRVHAVSYTHLTLPTN